MPIIIFDCKGVTATPRAHRGRRRSWRPATSKESYEGWIAADPFRGGIRVLMTGPHGFQRTLMFAMDEDPAVITERVRATIDE
jgi:hypothetical protein